MVSRSLPSQSSCVHSLHFYKVLPLQPLGKDSSFRLDVFPGQSQVKHTRLIILCFYHLSSISTSPGHLQPMTWTQEAGSRKELSQASPHSPAPKGEIHSPTEVGFILKNTSELHLYLLSHL